MKKIFFLFAFVLSIKSVFSQTIFTYGNNAVDKAEFLRAYEKNKTPVADKEKALREYLDLYIKFKLKVKAALDLKLDTLHQLIYDAQSFRSQIEQSYLNNEKAEEGLITEAFNRGKKDLHVLHFFVKSDTAMNIADSLNAYKTIEKIYKALNSGKTDYANIIAAGPATATEADLGFVTVFTLPYEYENIIYSLKEGQVNKPYRSKSGWHIFKLVDERKAVGKWKVAQILISIAPDATDTDKKNYKSRVDSVYHLLQNGGDFGKLARQFSDDKTTYGNNGLLPEFGTGKYDIAFENEIFKLSKDGEISKPFLSPYGYHIVKRISQTPVPENISDPAYLFDLKLKTEQDSRINIAKDLFLKEILKKVNFKKTNFVSNADLFRFADSVIKNPNAETSNKVKFPITQKVVGMKNGKTEFLL
ncbi:MAG TPA: peptidylprolyl isomerase, partial [Ferruginibacter sp.]|nr:peptidylprolyl isomerase [Ferruginibacter sp.]